MKVLNNKKISAQLKPIIFDLVFSPVLVRAVCQLPDVNLTTTHPLLPAMATSA